MLTSFGFAAGAPAASLGASELPERDATWLAANGCAGAVRSDLVLDAENALVEPAARDAVRCIRLRLYDRDEAEWALEIGHLDAPWGGAESLSSLQHSPDAARLGELLSSVLLKDLRIAENTARLCATALSDEKRAAQGIHLQAASADLRGAIEEETAALDACAAEFTRARGLIEARGRALFGEAE